MSIPLDEIYNYIDAVLGDDAIIYRFSPHGSKNIRNLTPLNTVSYHDNEHLPVVICHDQEPLDFESFQLNDADLRDYLAGTNYTGDDTVDWLPKLNLAYSCMNNKYQKKILLHSELNSVEVQKYIDSGLFRPVFWWSHAIIARDWFRYAEHDPIKSWPKASLERPINVYCRAWSGTREYRLFLLDKVRSFSAKCKIKFNPNDGDVHYSQYQFNNPDLLIQSRNFENLFDPYTHQDPEMSATYSATDYKNTLFDCVLETVVDDPRIHLTEKTLRPIALGQPFIMCAGPGSLEFIKSYGFRTFSEVIDESYDKEPSTVKRLSMVADLIEQICQRHWTDDEIDQLREVAEFNQKRFFSKDFHDQILSQLKKDLESEIAEVKTEYSTYWIDWVEQILSQSTPASQVFYCQRWLSMWDTIYQRLKRQTAIKKSSQA